MDVTPKWNCCEDKQWNTMQIKFSGQRPAIATVTHVPLCMKGNDLHNVADEFKVSYAENIFTFCLSRQIKYFLHSEKAYECVVNI